MALVKEAQEEHEAALEYIIKLIQIDPSMNTNTDVQQSKAKILVAVKLIKKEENLKILHILNDLVLSWKEKGVIITNFEDLSKRFVVLYSKKGISDEDVIKCGVIKGVLSTLSDISIENSEEIMNNKKTVLGNCYYTL